MTEEAKTESLKESLDFDAALGDAGTDVTLPEDGPRKKPSPTVLQMDEWGLRRGKELLAGEDFKKLEGADAHAVADFHAAAFEPDPTLMEGLVTDPLRQRFIRQLLDTPDFHALHTDTMLNVEASELAAAAFSRQYYKLTAEESERKEKEAESGDKTDPSKPPDPRAEEKEEHRADMAALRAAARALDEAEKDVEECKEAAAMGGMGPGSPGAYDPKRTAELYKKVRNNKALRRICELAGRFRRYVQGRQRVKTIHGYDDVTGVVMDNDPGRLLPAELAMLADDDLADDMLRRFVERQTMCREVKGTEPVARGPIIITVDESGSMQGEPVYAAKAIALALAWVASQQKRWCALVAFSGRTGHRLLTLPPGGWKEEQLLVWLAEFIGGGSYRDVPTTELPDYYKQLGSPEGKTDILMITDAALRLTDGEVSVFNSWKESVKARVTSLIVNGSPGALTRVSDAIYEVQSLDLAEDGVCKALDV